MRLFITEKFAFARVIATALASPRHAERQEGYFVVGRDYVSWTAGGLVELAGPEAYDERYQLWRMEQLPIFPSADPSDKQAWKHVERSHHAEQMAVLRKLLRVADEVVHAGATDREGQWHIDELLEYLQSSLSLRPVPVKRLLIGDMNLTAVRTALHHLHDNREFANLSESARARSHADWLYGINMSRAYTLLARHSGYAGERALSIGRVQTPMLALLVKRDESIEQFKAQPVVELTVKIASHDEKYFCHARWQSADDAAQRHDKQACEQLADRLLNTKGVVISRREQDIHEAPPLPYDLASLHLACATLYGYSASEVEESCRQLYEKHHLVSYPFVDCHYWPEEKFGQASDTIESILSILHHNVEKQTPALEQKIRQADCWLKRACWDSRQTAFQHAILPVESHADKMKLDEKEQQVYRLIVENYIAQFCADYKATVTEIVFGVEGEHFVFERMQIVQEGWKVLFRHEDSKARASPLPAGREYSGWQLHETIHCDDVSVKEKLTRPPERFTEASLMEALSQLSAHTGRASTLEALVDRGFVMKGHRHLFSTQLGKDLIHALPQADPLGSSLRWEQQLSAIAEGHLGYAQFMTAFRQELTEWITQARQKKIIAIHSADTILGLPTEEKFSCPRCQAVLQLRHGKQGDFWGCSRYPECKQTVPDISDGKGHHRPDFRLDESHTQKTAHRKPAEAVGKPCPDCGKPLVKRQGKHGFFAGCSGYPACKHTEIIRRGE